MHRKPTFMSCPFVSFLYFAMVFANLEAQFQVNEFLENLNLTDHEYAENQVSSSSTENPAGTKRIRKPVKLTMRQGLIMNQVVATYALADVKHPLCYNHTEEFKTGLRALEPWALQMFDASSKIQAGILMGNLMEYGSFRECLNVYETSEYGPIRGKFCTLKIVPGKKLLQTILSFRNITEKKFEKLATNVLDNVKIKWSVCVPDSCKANEVYNHFNKTIREVTEGLDIEITLNEQNCVSLKDEPKISSKEILFTSIPVVMMACVAVATFLDFVEKSDTKNWFVDVFSANSNGKRIFAKGLRDSELDCLHGLRFLSVCYVVCGHRYMEIMEFPTVNSLDLTDWISSYFSRIIIGGTVSVDTFFVISGMLLTYNFFTKVEKIKKFNLFYFYFLRYIRIAVPTGVAVIIFACVIQFFGSGPLWNETYVNMQRACQKFWWSSLLFIQNYVNPDSVCIIQSWYLTSSMLLFYCSPLIIYPLWKNPTIGCINLVFIYCLSLGVSFYLAWINKYSGAMPTTSNLLNTKYFKKYYIQAHTRAPTYIIGMAFGYIVFLTKDKKINFHFAVKTTGWILTGVLMLCPLIGEHVFLDENHVYNRFESSMFLAGSRSAWSLGITWIIWCCINGHGGIVNEVLSLHLFRVLGRIGFGIFIFHILFQFLKGGASKTPEYFSNFNAIYAFCADMVLMVLLGFGFSICFEYPVIRIQALIVKKTYAASKISPTPKM